MNDLPDAIHWSKAMLFADDTKCFNHIKSSDDEQCLQHDLHNLATWSITSYLSFNSSKSVHVHHIVSINTTHNHEDLGIIISKHP